MALFSIEYVGPNANPAVTQAVVIAPSAHKAVEMLSHLIPAADRADYRVTKESVAGSRLLFVSDEW